MHRDGRRIRRVIGVLVALVVLSACERASEGGGDMRPAGAAPVATAASPAARSASAAPRSAPSDRFVWRTLGSWSGSGDGQTGSFDVATGALRITWDARAGVAGDAPFSVVLHSAISGRELQTVVDTRGPGGATAYVQDEPRVSYLVIHGDDIEWRVSVEEGAAASDPGTNGQRQSPAATNAAQ